jgi:hypothetical protein
LVHILFIYSNQQKKGFAIKCLKAGFKTRAKMFAAFLTFLWSYILQRGKLFLGRSNKRAKVREGDTRAADQKKQGGTQQSRARLRERNNEETRW